MRIAIIGHGRVGSALAAGWTKAGHEVQSAGRSTAPSIGDIAGWAEIIVLAVPYAALESVAAEIAPATGKVVIDCTNPIVMGADGMALALGHTTSGAEQLQALLPDAHVIKTLNQVGAEIMADTRGFSHPPVQFLAGDEPGAKETVTTLLAEIGFDPLDAGGLSKARLLEPLALVWINQAIAQKKGRDWVLSALHRQA
ncbi:MAG: NAD(P)-binding domain-containing protein [Pseudomonadota bacterium]